MTPEVPTVIPVPFDDLADKAIASIREVQARGGPVIAVTNAAASEVIATADHAILVPATHKLLTPITFGIALQLFAYHVATALGRDIDQPRNLAKSVTVE